MDYNYQLDGNISEVLDATVKLNKNSNVGYLYFPRRYIGKDIKIIIVNNQYVDAILKKTIKQNTSSNVGYVYLPEEFAGKEVKILVMGDDEE